MRLLYLPLYTNKNLNGDSSYNVASKFIASAVERGWFVHWVLPQVGGGSRFHYEGSRAAIENHPQVLVHRVPSIEDQYMQTGVVPADVLFRLFSQHQGRYHIDAVLTEKPASAAYVRKLLQHPFTRPAKGKNRWLGKTPALPMFVRDPFTKSQELHIISDVEEVEQSVGYLTSYSIFMCQTDFDMASKVAKRYLNYGQVKKMQARSVVLPPGTATAELLPVREAAVKRDRFTVLIAERLKNGALMDSLDAVDYMFKRGYQMDVVISSQSELNRKTLMNYPTVFEHAELHPANPRDQYLPLAAACHATITMPSTHSYPQGLMERLYLGLVAVLPDYPWVHTLLPDYPFVVKRNVKSMVAMLKWIEENYEEAKQKVAWVPGYIEEHYDAQLLAEKTMRHIEETTALVRASSAPSSGFLELIDQFDFDEADEETLFEYMKAHSTTGLSFNNEGKTAAFGSYKSQLFQAMRHRGWEDTCEGPFVTMRRKS